MLGNGNGTFDAAVSYASGPNLVDIRAVDVNQDGELDLLTTSITDKKLNVHFGNGDGTFSLSNAYYLGSHGQFHVADVNGDGLVDVA